MWHWKVLSVRGGGSLISAVNCSILYEQGNYRIVCQIQWKQTQDCSRICWLTAHQKRIRVKYTYLSENIMSSHLSNAYTLFTAAKHHFSITCNKISL